MAILLLVIQLPGCVHASNKIKHKEQTRQMATRKADYKVAEPIINRWSSRAMSGESVSHDELMSLFEAARWAPSSYNNQPWRFIYATRDGKDWQKFMDLLVPFNQMWCKNAGALVVITSSNNFTDAVPNPSVVGTPSNTHSFDTGAAFQNMGLQGYLNGLVVHGMAGFDYAKAKEVLNIPDDYTVEAMVAVGKPGDVKDLPVDFQKGELPTGRKPVSEIVFEGKFGNNLTK